MQLYNLIDRKVLEAQMANDEVIRITVSFYKYHHIGNPEIFRNSFYEQLDAINALGRIYVAHEGVNAQMSVPKENFEAFAKVLEGTGFLKGVRLNLAREEKEVSFIKLKIKHRPKILADGLTDDTFDVINKGKHLNAEEFNKLIEDPNTIVVDMRNHYESEVGYFEGSLKPDVDTFRDSLPVIEELLQPHVDKNIAMYCTGGIRCEKASAWFKHKGFKKVHQLEGGIIGYDRQVKEQGLENKYIGKNFVFDKRMAESIGDEIIANCHQCGNSCDTHVNCANEACHLLLIQCESCKSKYEGCCCKTCKDFNSLPEEEQRRLRKDFKFTDSNIYKKGRVRPKLTQQIAHKLKDL